MEKDKPNDCCNTAAVWVSARRFPEKAPRMQLTSHPARRSCPPSPFSVFACEACKGRARESKGRSLEYLLSDSQVGLLQLSILSLIIAYFLIFFDRSANCDNDLQIANRGFSLEPRILALVRWALRARTILDSAYKAVGGTYACMRAVADRTSSMAVYTRLLEEISIWS